HRAAGLGWPVRPAWLADHVHRRGGSDGADRDSHPIRADRSASAGEIPHGGGKNLAERQTGFGTEGEGGGAYVQYAARDVRSEGTAAGAQLFRDRRRHPGDTVFLSPDIKLER